MLRLSFGCWNYDRTRALMDKTRVPDGIDLIYLNMPVEETFFRMLRHREFDVAEMSLSSYVGLLLQGAAPLRRHPGVPVALLPPLVDLRERGSRHPRAGGPQRQADRLPRVSDDRAGVDPRHPVGRIRREGR